MWKYIGVYIPVTWASDVWLFEAFVKKLVFIIFVD